MLDKIVKVIIDRPMGSAHPKYSETIYPINYGFVEGIFALDKEEQDCYVLGVDKAIKEFTGNVIAIIKRKNDIEDKWVVSNRDYSIEEIRKDTYFTEQYFDSEIVKE